jgi:TonB family protein
VFLDRLQSGFLLFETQQGLVRVELSLGQRIYLLWTFRNFRRLSVPLLNSRQRALVNSLFRNKAGVVSHLHKPLPVIGVVENFVPPSVRIGASPAWKKERQEKVVVQRAEIAAKPNPVPPSSPRLAWSRLVTTVGALSLCIISVVAWHRIQGIPGSQANNQPRLQQINAIALPNSPHSAKPAAAIAENPTAIAPSAATAQPLAAPEAGGKPASIVAVIPHPKQEIRVHDAASTPNLRLPDDSGIQASRPPLRFVYPVYPDVRARGVVALTARVDSDGTVRTVRIVSGDRALAAAAVRAIRQWRYRPYLKDGQPVATETNIVISFLSNDAISMTFPPNIPAR